MPNNPHRKNHDQAIAPAALGILKSATTALDPIRFARRLGFSPDPRQTELLCCNSTSVILNCSRQWGKSTICSLKALHVLMAEKEALAVVVSPSDRQSREFVRKTATFVRKLGFKVRGDGDNDVSLLLPNGSRLIGLPGKESTIRGFSSVSMLLIDEAAQVTDELYKAIRPMRVVSNGGIWMMSTPFGRRGFFWETWSAGGSEWTRIKVPATDCPRIAPEVLAKEKAALGDRQYRQEYMCEFISDNHALFDEDLLRSLIRDDIPSLMQRINRENPNWNPPSAANFISTPDPRWAFKSWSLKGGRKS